MALEPDSVDHSRFAVCPGDVSGELFKRTRTGKRRRKSINLLALCLAGMLTMGWSEPSEAFFCLMFSAMTDSMRGPPPDWRHGYPPRYWQSPAAPAWTSTRPNAPGRVYWQPRRPYQPLVRPPPMHK